MKIMLCIAVVAAAAFIVVHEMGMEKLKLPMKSAASVCFTLLGALCLAQGERNLYGVLVLAALALGCVGDILLEIPGGGDRCFLAGLVSFLLGHAVYIAAFVARGGFAWIQPVAALLLIVSVLLMFRLMKVDFGAMKLPAHAYCVVIGLMLGCSVTVSPIVCAGAALFVLSDIVLALIRFAGKTQKGMTMLNLTTYYAAQILLALSIVL